MGFVTSALRLRAISPCSEGVFEQSRERYGARSVRWQERGHAGAGNVYESYALAASAILQRWWRTGRPPGTASCEEDTARPHLRTGSWRGHRTVPARLRMPKCRSLRMWVSTTGESLDYAASVRYVASARTRIASSPPSSRNHLRASSAPGMSSLIVCEEERDAEVAAQPTGRYVSRLSVRSSGRVIAEIGFAKCTDARISRSCDHPVLTPSGVSAASWLSAGRVDQGRC